jgi:AcrR family transcriptional regulator
MAAPRRRKRLDHRVRVGRERSARTEARILDAALRLFVARGDETPTIEDVVRAAGVSRGTFYNYFDSVDALRTATSEWTTRGAFEAIESAMTGVEGPLLRYALGTRLLFAKAQADPVWCRFVAEVWSVGGVEYPLRDVEDGLRAGVFQVPNKTAVWDLLSGSVRAALVRIASGRATPEYGAQMTELFLRALGADARRVAAAMKHALPPLPNELPPARRPSDE